MGCVLSGFLRGIIRIGFLTEISRLRRAILGFPSMGSQSKGRAALLTGQTGFAPNTETFSAVYPISVSYRSQLARSPGGLGGREPVAAQSPERSFFFPLFLSAEKEKEVIGGDAVGKSLSPKQNPTDYIIIPLRTSSLSQAKLSQQPRPLFSAASASLCTLSPRQPCLSRYRRR